MAIFKNTVTIHAPVEKVFQFMTDPRNLPEVWPAMKEVHAVSASPLGAYNFSWTYKMAGMNFEGASEVTEYIHNKLHVTHSKKGIESTFRCTYEAVEGGTRYSMEIEYKVPVPLVGKLAEAMILKQNEHDIEILFQNLKQRMEKEMPIPA